MAVLNFFHASVHQDCSVLEPFCLEQVAKAYRSALLGLAATLACCKIRLLICPAI